MEKTYFSIEGDIVKAFIPKKNIEDSKFFEFSRDELMDFIKENSIKELYISAFFPDLYTFRFSLPFQIPNKKKILERLIFNEIQKRYPSLQQFSFIYETQMVEKRNWIRCYVVPDFSYSFIEEILKEKINIKALYPMHIPLISLVDANSELKEKNKLVCFLSGKSRFLFIFEKSEMLLTREFEGSDDITEEDVLNINMTVNYAVQNLRVNLQEIVFVGAEDREISGLIVPYRFLSVLPQKEKYAVLLSMLTFDEKLKNSNMLPREYKKFKQITKYLNYVGFTLIIAGVMLLGYNINSLYKLKSQYETLTAQRQYILKHEQEFVNFQRTIQKFETDLKPFVELQNRRNSMTDTRQIITNIAQAKPDLIQLDSLEISNSEKLQIRIKGKSSGKSFSERQISYLKFKSSLTEKGFKITNENWDISKGDLSIDAVYEH